MYEIDQISEFNNFHQKKSIKIQNKENFIIF